MIIGRLCKLDNTKSWLLDALEHGPFTAHNLATFRYPQSKQLAKKSVTFQKHLRQLERSGRVKRLGSLWVKPDARGGEG